MRGGGLRPFGTFPKIHPFWKGDASLSHTDSQVEVKWNQVGFPTEGTYPSQDVCAVSME